MTPEAILKHSLKDLTESLRIGMVVFIENDFKPVSDADQILSGMVGLNEIDKRLLAAELSAKGFGVFLGHYDHFYSDYSKLVQTKETTTLVSLGKMLPAINKLPDNTSCLASHTTVTGHIASLPNDNLFQICFKYGIGQTPDTYNPIFNELKNTGEKLSFRYYTQVVAAEIESFSKDISEVTDISKKSSYLCIVDKMLGEEKHEGFFFVKNDLPQISAATSTIPISFIFSSQPDQEGELDTIEQYFSRQVNKNSDNVSDEITLRLAQCAYAKIFQQFQAVYNESCNDAANLVIKNHKNLNHILSKAQHEGLTPFEAIFNWFQTAVDMNVQKKLTSDYSMTFGLARFFDNRYLPAYSNNEEIDKELLELNTFEIFDYDINKKHLSLGVGDIFCYNDRYFVVIGQECDLLIREEDNLRNDKVIELLDAKFEKSKSNQKVAFKYDDSNKTITIENFVNEKGERGCLKITNLTNHKLASPDVLDLSMFDEDGHCKIDLSKDLDEKIKFILPKGKDKYFEKLVSTLRAVHAIKQATPEIAEQFDFLAFNNYKYDITDPAAPIDYKIKRVCRFKGNFKYFVNKAFYDFRSRIDLNLINNTEESYELKKVTFKLGTLKQKEIESVRIYQTAGKFHIKKNEVLDELSDELLTLVNLLPDSSIHLQSGDRYDVTDGAEVTINLFFIRSINNSSFKPIKGNKASVKELLSANKSIESNHFQYTDDTTTVSIFEQDGTTLKIFDLDTTFLRKVKIDHNGLKHIYIKDAHLIVENAPAGNVETQAVVTAPARPVPGKNKEESTDEKADNLNPKTADKKDEEKTN